MSIRTGPARWEGGAALLVWGGRVAGRGIGRLLTGAASHPTRAVVAVGLLALVVSAARSLEATAAGAVLAVELVAVWALAYPARARAVWRRWWVYRRRWSDAMRVAGLYVDDERVPARWRCPRLSRVRCTPTADVVRVRGLLGQRFAMWEEAGPMLAHVFGATGVVVHRGDDRRLTLELRRGRVGKSWQREGFDVAADI